MGKDLAFSFPRSVKYEMFCVKRFSPQDFRVIDGSKPFLVEGAAANILIPTFNCWVAHMLIFKLENQTGLNPLAPKEEVDLVLV